MSLLFGKVAFVWTIFDHIDEEEQDAAIVFMIKLFILLKKTIIKLILENYTLISFLYQRS